MNPSGREWLSSGIPSGIKDEVLLNERRARVVDKATDLFIERGFGQVSVNEIAEFAGISVGSLYKYIRTKEDLLWLVMGSIYGTLDEVLHAEQGEAQDPVQSLDRVVRRFFYEINAVRRGVLLMYREYRSLPPDGRSEFMKRERRIVEIFRGIIEDGNASGAFRCPSPGMAAVDILMAAHIWCLKRWLLEKDTDFGAFVEQQMEFIFRAVGRDPGEQTVHLAGADARA